MAVWREKLFVLMARNAVRATAFFRLPRERVVELGQSSCATHVGVAPVRANWSRARGRVKGATNVTRERRRAPMTRPRGRAELKTGATPPVGRTPAYAGARLARDRTCAVTASVYVCMGTFVSPATAAICTTSWTRPCTRFVHSKSRAFVTRSPTRARRETRASARASRAHHFSSGTQT
jgi:hypothetical protein